VTIVPTVGLPRAVSAAPNVAMALGYDVEVALEQPAPARTSDPAGQTVRRARA